MPELPEVEVVRRGLAPRLAGRTILAIHSSGKKLRRPLPEQALRTWVEQAGIVAVERRAKYLLFPLANGALLVLHLGMTGKVGLFAAGDPPATHDHLRFRLDSGLELRFQDVRRFGFVEVYSPEELQASDPFAALGPEPFWETFSGAYLQERARGRRQPVKSFLMDNRVVVGIGNIYASEILFAAGILPTTPAAALSRAHWDLVAAKAREVLRQAIAAGGTTIIDFTNAEGRSGSFQNELQVYGRQGLECRRCGAPISRTVLAGRATFFCGECQGESP